MKLRTSIASAVGALALAGAAAYAPAASADRVGFNVTFGGPGYAVNVGNAGYGYYDSWRPAPVVVAPYAPYYRPYRRTIDRTTRRSSCLRRSSCARIRSTGRITVIARTGVTTIARSVTSARTLIDHGASSDAARRAVRGVFARARRPSASYPEKAGPRALAQSPRRRLCGATPREPVLSLRCIAGVRTVDERPRHRPRRTSRGRRRPDPLGRRAQRAGR